jgi:hypothetical protein
LSIYFKGAIDTAIMEIAALLLPAVTLTLLAVMGFIIVFGFAFFANEKRYLAIIDALIKDKKTAITDRLFKKSVDNLVVKLPHCQITICKLKSLVIN